ncbi:MAG: hypothetical protein CL674_16580 [Bdellovibrionaceae bacterium]|nr:hypothetical protein [Pseudobdellovibrionaceae bacterium]
MLAQSWHDWHFYILLVFVNHFRYVSNFNKRGFSLEGCYCEEALAQSWHFEFRFNAYRQLQACDIEKLSPYEF